MELIPAFVIAYSDSSFTNPHEVARPDDPPDCRGSFTHMGAKYWGFETLRHKATQIAEDGQGYRFDHHAFHWIHLGFHQPAEVSRITVSTRWFTGNQVPEIAIELKSGENRREVLARTPLLPDSEHSFDIQATAAGECIIRCYHEGGIARINCFGELIGSDTRIPNLLEQARISHVSNEHYGKPADAVTGNREVDYMLGWESARTGFGEQALFHLNKPARIESIIVDTYMHRLNPPLSCHIYGINTTDAESAMMQQPRYEIEFDDDTVVLPDNFQAYMSAEAYLDEPVAGNSRFGIRLHNPAPSLWFPLVGFGQLRADTWHHFKDIEYREPVTHILYMHYPNGGIHGLKVYGSES